MKKILYIVATQYDNMGDLLINKCLIDELAEYGQVYLDTKKVPTHFKEVLLEHKNVYELGEISSLSLKGKGALLLPFYRDFKFDYMFKSPGPFGGAISINDKLRSYIFYYLFLVMKIRGTKSFLIGNDFMLKSNFDKKIIKKYNQVLDGILVRSLENVEQLKLCGAYKTQYAPDLCFMMKTNTDSIKKNRVALSFREMTAESNIEIKKSVKIFIDYFSERNIEIDVFYQVERDREFNFNLYNEFKTNNVSFREKVLSWKERDYYQNKAIVLSNRLHVLLLGQTYKSIPIALIFGESSTIKIKNIYRGVGLKDVIVQDVNVSNLEKIYFYLENWTKKINTVNLTQKSIFESHLHKIFIDSKK